jgi:hypothetical protein
VPGVACEDHRRPSLWAEYTELMVLDAGASRLALRPDCVKWVRATAVLCPRD